VKGEFVGLGKERKKKKGQVGGTRREKTPRGEKREGVAVPPANVRCRNNAPGEKKLFTKESRWRKPFEKKASAKEEGGRAKRAREDPKAGPDYHKTEFSQKKVGRVEPGGSRSEGGRERKITGE